MLTDAAAIIAYFDRDAKYHPECVKVVAGMRERMVTTWLTYGEAYYLIGKKLGREAQDDLLSLVADNQITLHTNMPGDIVRMQILVRRYKDIARGGMDLADASLVVAAETLGLREVFTLDSHFYAYRPGDTGHFTVLPSVALDR